MSRFNKTQEGRNKNNTLKFSVVALKMTFFTLLLLTSFYAHSQSQYYWSNNQKIELTEDKTAVSIKLSKKQLSKAFETHLKSVKAVQSFDYQESSQRVLVYFYQAIAIDKIANTLNIEPENIQYISYAQRLNDGFPLWLTPQIVLKTKRGVTISAIERAFPDQKMTISENIYDDFNIIKLEDTEKVIVLANKIKESGLVEWCHPDFYAKKTKHIDPFYADQFQLNNTGQSIDGIRGVNDIDCNAPEAWTITKGASDLIVAVIDDGVEDHEDLVDADGRSRVLSGYTPFNNGTGNPNSDGAHGQSCAGIIAATHNDIGVRGIAPEVQILPINIFAGEETISQLANAFNFARINNAAVLSNSWGYSTCEGRFDALDQAIANAANNGRDGKGSIITFASGNSALNCVEYPANLSTVLGVGAVTNRGLRSDYSNYGSALDLVAPSNGASGVRTIDRMGRIGYANGNYTGDFGGTSAACPVVSGVAALLLSAYPELTANQANSLLLNTAVDMGAAGKDNEYGYGRVDAYAALLAAAGDESFGYCSSQGQSVADEWIGGFELGTYSNSSNAATYSDFTSEIIPLQAGETYPIKITPEYSGQSYQDAFRVWIDYDQNEIFEADELVFEAGPSNQAVSGNITIPAAVSGSTRMRVALKYETFSEACETFEYGEVEDYTLSFQENNVVACEIPSVLNAFNFENSNATFSWEAVNAAISYDFRVRTVGGNWVPFTAVTATEIILTNFEAGLEYEFTVRSNCADGNSSEYASVFRFEYTTESIENYCAANGNASQYQWIDLIELNEISNPTADDGGYADYTNLVANIQKGKTETIYISKGPNTDYTFNWNIYIDYDQNGVFESEELIVKGASDSNDVLYGEFDVPDDAKTGTTRMRILLKYNEESDACGTFSYGEVEDYSVNVRTAATNTNNSKSIDALALNTALKVRSSNLELSVFPNPTSDFLQLKSSELLQNASLSIVDATGKRWTLIEHWNGELINVQQLPNGFYNLLITNDIMAKSVPFVKEK